MRLLPWAAAFRHLGHRKFWLDCDRCKANPHVRRPRMRCGWLAPEKWDGEVMAMVPEIAVPQCGIHRPTVCPGYTIQLPAVVEAVRAWGHWERGQLQLRYREPPQRLLDLVEMFHQERSAAEAYALNERTNAAKRGA